MEHVPKQPSQRVAPTIQLNLKPDWAKGLRELGKKYELKEANKATRTLIYDGEVPIVLTDYQKIVNDLMAFGCNDILKILLANLPPEVTEFQLIWRLDKWAFDLLSMLKVLVQALLLNPKGRIAAVHFRNFCFTKEELSLLADAIANTSTLQVVTFDSCQMRQEGDIPEFFKCLLQKNKTIKSLRLTATPTVKSNLVKYLEGNGMLSHLKLMRPSAPPTSFVLQAPTPISKVASALRQVHSLSSFDCDVLCDGQEDLHAVLRALSGHAKLKRLTLRDALDIDAVDALHAMLKSMSLEELLLGSVQVGGRGHAEQLAKALGTVTLLSIDGNQLSSDETRRILSVLLANERLTQLQWAHVNLDIEGEISVGKMIRENTKLRSLSLPGANRSLQSVLDAMEFNSCIDVLNLTGSCNMSASSFMGLEKNNKLTRLIISKNEMDAVACKKIVPFISNHSSITCIEMSSCHIGDDGFKEISKAMEGNATIKELDLTGNSSSNAALNDFIRCFKSNHGLVKLKLLGTPNQLKLISKDALRAGLLQHPSLIDFDHHFHTSSDEALIREIDLHLHTNFARTNPAVTQYLRNVLRGFTAILLGFKDTDIGYVIWKYFLKDETAELKAGVLADMAALRDVLHVRQVLLGSPEYRGRQLPSPAPEDSSAEPPTKIQKLN